MLLHKHRHLSQYVQLCFYMRTEVECKQEVGGGTAGQFCLLADVFDWDIR